MKLIGLARLGRDVEIRVLPSGEAVANLALAYNFGKKGEDGNKPTQWVEAALWGDRADKLQQWLVKGQQLLIEVKDVHIETYDKNDGGVGVKLVGTVGDLDFAGPPPQSQVSGQGSQGGGQAGGQQRQPAGRTQGGGQGSSQGSNGGGQRSNGGNGGNPQRQQPSQNRGPDRSNQDRQQQAPRQAPAQRPASGFDDMDDDIPF